MLIDIAQTVIQSPIDPTHLSSLHAMSFPHMDLLFNFDLPHSDLLAQGTGMIKETDISGDVSKMWQKFVKTGQVWAFLAGIFVGYLVKTFTSFG